MVNKKRLREIKGGAELFGAMLELDSTQKMLEYHLEDLKLETASTRKALRSVRKRYKLGAELYKKHHGREINLSMKG